MPLLVGNAGSVKIAANMVAEITKWDVNVGVGLGNTQSFGDTWEESSPTMLKASGSFSGNATSGDTNGQIALRTAALAGTTVALRLYENASNYYSGSAFIQLAQGAEVNAPAGTVSYSFTFTGTVSYT